MGSDRRLVRLFVVVFVVTFVVALAARYAHEEKIVHQKINNVWHAGTYSLN